MSINIATEVRRISDARSRLKSIIDAMAQSQAAQLSPDDLKYQTNTTLAQSKKTVSDDTAVQKQGAIAVSSLTAPLSPIEPDFDTLKIWLPFTNLGKQNDLALLGNTGTAFGAATIVNGPTSNDNGLFAGTALRAVYFDGYTCYCDVKDAAGMRLADCPTGFTLCCRIKIQEYNTQVDNPTLRRTIAIKTDDASNAWSLELSPTNGDLLFHVKRAGTEYKAKFTGMALNTWYDIVCTYTSGNVMTIYRNNVSSTTADTTASQYPASTDTSLHIGRANSTIYEGDEMGLGPAFDPFAFDPLSFDASSYINRPVNSLQFNGLATGSGGNSVQISDANTYKGFTNVLTVAAWAKVTNSEGGYGGIVAGLNSASGSNRFLIAGDFKTLLFQINAGVNATYVSPTSLQNAWHHYACVYDGTQIQLYLDGLPVGTPTSTTANLSAGSTGMLIGWGSPTIYHFGGKITDVRLYNAALTSDEIVSLYSGQQDVDRSILSRFAFTEGMGTVTNDIVGGIPGTLVNSPVWSTDIPTTVPLVPEVPHSTIDGGFRGSLADIRFYNFPLSSAQVGYLYTNKFSISNIAYGAVASSGYCISHS